jgi:cell pole-organizing protein PopZ
MSNADQASEPTMEEILSSIRKIISDDDKGGTPPVAKAAARPRPAAPPPVAKVEPVAEPEPEPEAVSQSGADDIFDLTEVVEEETAADSQVDDWEIAEEGLLDPDTLNDIGFSDPEPEPAPEPVPIPVVERPVATASRPAAPKPEPLLSSAATEAASSAFGELANTLLSRNNDARTLEELVQEMLRPMLKTWLDENLPPMVERLVREEIERVTRRR